MDEKRGIELREEIHIHRMSCQGQKEKRRMRRSIELCEEIHIVKRKAIEGYRQQQNYQKSNN